MGEQPLHNVKRSFLNGVGRLIPVPAPGGNQRRQASGQSPSLWLQCTSWLKYHSTQLRWDIERFVARRLNHRWGSR
jgi:hypothetical protein